MTAYTIVRVAKSGQLCTMDMSGFELDGFATAFSKACDNSATFQARYESAKYTAADGKIAYAMGDVDYTGSLRDGKLVVEFDNRATHNQGNTEYERFLLDDEPADGAQVVEGVLDDRGVGDDNQDLHATAACEAAQNVDGEDLPEQ